LRIATPLLARLVTLERQVTLRMQAVPVAMVVMDPMPLGLFLLNSALLTLWVTLEVLVALVVQVVVMVVLELELLELMDLLELMELLQCFGQGLDQ